MHLKNKDKNVRKVYFSSDTQMKNIDVLDYYQTRFQVEFCFRDAKQFIGLTDCQSRDLNKLHIHLNASLTNVNMAKAKALEKNINMHLHHSDWNY